MVERLLPLGTGRDWYHKVLRIGIQNQPSGSECLSGGKGGRDKDVRKDVEIM